MQVAVIGAGAAGLCALRCLKEHPKGFLPTGFETSSTVGGTWNYTEKTGTDERGLPIHSSMYKNLRTNLPKEIMAFPDFPFDAALPSFLPHDDVVSYLRDYARHFELDDIIKFNTAVDMVTPISGTNPPKWRVTYSHVDSRQQRSVEEFDSVFVCNGHYTIPLIPEVPGLEEFRGEVIHSHNYRHPSTFCNKAVVLLGAGASGQDIALDVSSTAKQVFLSSRKSPMNCDLPVNVQQIPGLKYLNERSAVFDDGREEPIDCLLLCTGYRYSFPFLAPEIGLEVDHDEIVSPVYKHLIHMDYPTLFLVGLCKTVCPFPHFHVQILTALAVLSGEVELPSKPEMENDVERSLNVRLSNGHPRRYAHVMGPLQWDYIAELVEFGKFRDPIPPNVKELYDYIHETRVKNLMGYKKLEYKLVGEESFSVNP